jgi:hypothetical protein
VTEGAQASAENRKLDAKIMRMKKVSQKTAVILAALAARANMAAAQIQKLLC